MQVQDRQIRWHAHTYTNTQIETPFHKTNLCSLSSQPVWRLNGAAVLHRTLLSASVERDVDEYPRPTTSVKWFFTEYCTNSSIWNLKVWPRNWRSRTLMIWLKNDRPLQLTDIHIVCRQNCTLAGHLFGAWRLWRRDVERTTPITKTALHQRTLAANKQSNWKLYSRSQLLKSG